MLHAVAVMILEKSTVHMTRIRRRPLSQQAPAASGLTIPVPEQIIASAFQHYQVGRLNDAVAGYRSALALQPGYADVHRNLGIALEHQGKLEEAVACYRCAIKLKPSYAEAYGNLALVLEEQGLLEEAVTHSHTAIALKADFGEVYSNLASVLIKLGRLDEAVTCCRRAIELKPDLAEAYNNLGRALSDRGQIAEALANYAKALEMKPSDLRVFSNLLFTRNYLADHSPERMRNAAQQFGVLVSAHAERPLTKWAAREADRPLRVGLVSGDLRNHAVGFFLESVLRAIDPKRVELLAFPSSAHEDELTSRLRPNFKVWMPICGMGDEAAARMIHAQGVHVLIDLSGHTAGNRLPLFGWRPAPVQATWLGYFATTGVAEMDYIIGDPTLTPSDDFAHFTETAWPLPDISYCFTPPAVAAPESSLPAQSNGYLTFGCFSNLAKVSDAVIAVWARVLEAVPDSRIMLKTKQFRDAAMRIDIGRRFARHGITAERLLIEPPSNRGDYLLAYHRIDIVLDTFPYPGATTSAEALWMGVPVLTRRGDRFLSHFGETIMQNAGLSDWIAASDDDYVKKVVHFASDVAQLARLRARLRSQVSASPLFDAPRFARHFEDALWGMSNRASGQHIRHMNRKHRMAEKKQKISVKDMFAVAIHHHQAGRLIEAETLYRQILIADSRHADSLQMLGVVAQQTGRGDAAVNLIRRAIAIDARVAAYHSNLGNVLLEQGRLDEASASLHRALLLAPNNADAHNTLGTTLKAQGRRQEAAASFRSAIGIAPDSVVALNNLGNVLRESGHLNEAAVCYRRALDLSPGYPEAHNNLGIVLGGQGRMQEAAACYRTALGLRHDYSDAHNNLGNTLKQQGLLDEAADCYDSAIRLRPDYPEAFNNRGTVFIEQGNTTEAVGCYRKALELRPDYAEAHYNLGNAHKEQGLLDEAVVCYGRAIMLQPDYPEAHNNLGSVLSEQGLVDEALAHYAKAVEIRPTYFEAFSNRLFTQNYVPSPAPKSATAMARQFGVLATNQVAGRAYQTWTEAPPDGTLRIGIVSGDLCAHPVSYFLESLLRTVDPTRITFMAFPCRNHEDELTRRIKPFFKVWEPLHGRSDQAAANRIHANGVQILLDLSGHTAHNRLPIFAWRPAPVQATWLGYFATTGVAEMDYFLGDARLTAQEEADQFTEAVWRLPDLSSCFMPPNESVDITELPAVSNHYVTFGCFNNLTKVNESVVAVWARVLKAVPLSRLMLKANQFRDTTVCSRVRARFAAHGVTEDRLLIDPPSTRIDYLRAYDRIDLALDPFPYPGGTTSFEALWMGSPVLTKRGSCFLANAGGTIMRNAGLPDWIAEDDNDYVAKAICFASDIGYLKALRSGLRQQVLASPLCDAPRFARHFEDAMSGMWKRWLSMQRS